MAAEIEIEQRAATFLGRRPAPGLPIHDADGADPGFVDRAVEQPLDLRGRHVHALAGEREDLAHADADELVGLVGLEGATVPRLLSGRPQLGQPREELVRSELVRWPMSTTTR